MGEDLVAKSLILLLAACAHPVASKHPPLLPGDPPPATGVVVVAHVFELQSDAPIANARVVVLKPEVNPYAFDLANLDALALSKGFTDAAGDATLQPPLAPGIYSTVTTGPDHDPNIGENALSITSATTSPYDPWEKIRLKRR